MIERVLICATLFLISAAEHHWTSKLAHHRGWKKLERYECGISAADRIIGGVNAALGQFPWLVRLGYKVPDEDDLDWMCGGALISEDRVITAAHCILANDDVFKLSKIRVGEYDTRSDPDCQLTVCAPPVQDRRIKFVVRHPSFNKPPFHNDIAVIALDKPVQLNDYVSPICLPTEDQFAELLHDELVTVAGWGKMNMTTEKRADVLQFISLPVLEPRRCDTFGKNFKMDASEICAGAQQNKDACGGDSGGPLMKVFDTDEGPKYFLVGVVSFGPTICGIHKPGVYTFVPYFMNWILETL